MERRFWSKSKGTEVGGGERRYDDRERDGFRGIRWEDFDFGEGHRDDSGDIKVLSQSIMSLSSPSTARCGGRLDEGEENEKSSNMVGGGT